jgi:predicted dienelactone hydrolase
VADRLVLAKLLGGNRPGEDELRTIDPAAPTGRSTGPAVLLLHGRGSALQGSQMLATAFREHGFDVAIHSFEVFVKGFGSRSGAGSRTA